MSDRGVGAKIHCLVIACATIVAAVGGVASRAFAQTAPKPCYERALKQPFTEWGDDGQYFVAPSGNFERGFGSVRPSGSAYIVAENEPWRINGNNDWASAELGPGGSISTREFCVKADEELIRFFYRKPGIPGSALMVKVTARNFGTEVVTTTILDGSIWGWELSPPIQIPCLRDGQGQQYITIAMAPINSWAAWWRIDDIMVDPSRQK